MESPSAFYLPLSLMFVCLPPPLGFPLSPPQRQESPCTWLRLHGALMPLVRVLSTAPLTQ